MDVGVRKGLVGWLGWVWMCWLEKRGLKWQLVCGAVCWLWGRDWLAPALRLAGAGAAMNRGSTRGGIACDGRGREGLRAFFRCMTTRVGFAAERGVGNGGRLGALGKGVSLPPCAAFRIVNERVVFVPFYNVNIIPAFDILCQGI